VINLQRLAEDGAVFYLNGTEVMRNNMPTGPITSTSLASSDRGAVWEGPTAVPGVQMSAGTNTLAVELHTATTFALSYTYSTRITADINSYALGPVVITTQPTNTAVFEGQTATFSINGAGPAYFQWRSNGVNIAGATNPVLTVPNVLFSMNSNRYSVVASNKSFSATSSNAVLTVLTDTNKPSLLSAYVISGTQILATFSKPVSPATATVLANYAITNRTAPNVVITGAAVTNGTNVILTVTPASSTGTYVLVVNNVKDTSIAGNVIYPNSAVTIGLNYDIPIDAVWAYNQSGLDLGVNWRTVGFAETPAGGWTNGAALLYNEGAGLPGPKNTPLNLSTPPNGYIFTFYFRGHIPLALGASNVTVLLRHIIDDGAVMYINNSEFTRFNMPAGAVAYNTQGTTAVGDAAYTPTAGTLTFAWTNMVGGDNVLAVEVHQSGTASSDIVFGTELNLSAASTRFPTNFPAKLFIGKVPSAYTVFWTNAPGYALQATPRLLTPPSATVWTNIPTAQITVGPVTSTYSVNVTNKPPSYFRLKL